MLGQDHQVERDIARTVEKDGFAIVPGVLDNHEVALVLKKLEAAQLRRSRAGIRHLMCNGDVAALAAEPRLLRLASEILGSEAFPFRATLFDKSPVANWLVVWHQDTALPLRERKETPGWGPWSVKEGIVYAHAPTVALNQVIALRVHLDPSTEQNGPLRVLPETHKLGVLTDDEVFRLSTEKPALDCVAEKGAVLAMRPLLIHSSSKSQIETPRRVLHIEYASSMLMGDGLELAVA
jgi:ectoine hydroxylase-related dioxygenase (phytanoyl-CoA dioxygenase family)